MKLQFVRSHKSISAFPAVELPNFVIITGINGAGKSHLLEAIDTGAVQIEDIASNAQPKPIRLFNWANLVPQDSGAIAPFQIAQERYPLWTQMSEHINAHRPQIVDVLRSLNRPDLAKIDLRILATFTEEDFVARGISLDEAKQCVLSVQNAFTTANQNVESNFIRNDPQNRQRLVEQFRRNTRIPFVAFEEEDFHDYFPQTWTPVDMFQQSFGRLFAAYRSYWLSNRLKRLAYADGEAVKFLSDEEFIARYGTPPWEFVNNVLETAKLDFRINQPDKYDDRPYEPILTEQTRGTKVKFTDLSSGERILMSFALCLYYAEDGRQLVDYPRVLLFDEIDAPLHPSMTQSLLRTIQEVLVEKHNIKVMLTTHSPSTVALAPADSLYVMSKHDSQRILKTSKDRALAILTAGVPTLSIDYDNRRQVFVESQYDVEYYELLYAKLREHLEPAISLVFISAGVGGQGNCDQVKDVVNQLAQGGNRTVYGIIDWDTKNVGNERVKVLGRDKRYSIENYILDPLLVGAFLLREKYIERTDVGLAENEKYADLSTIDNAKLQTIINFVIDKVRSSVHASTEEQTEECHYVGGRTISLPLWFLRMQGHQLEKCLKECFPQLKRYQKEYELKREILCKVVDDMPDLVSNDFVALFQDIQNVNRHGM